MSNDEGTVDVHTEDVKNHSASSQRDNQTEAGKYVPVAMVMKMLQTTTVTRQSTNITYKIRTRLMLSII